MTDKQRDDEYWIERVRATETLDEEAEVLISWMTTIRLAQGYAQRVHEETRVKEGSAKEPCDDFS